MDSPGFSAAVTLISESVVPHIEYKKKKGKKKKKKQEKHKECHGFRMH